MDENEPKNNLTTKEKEKLFIKEVNKFLKTILNNEIEKVNNMNTPIKDPYNEVLIFYPYIKEDIKKVIYSYLIKTGMTNFKFKY